MKSFKELTEANKRTKKDIKEEAQDELMLAMQVAFNNVSNREVVKEMDRQFKRVEKLFGYNMGSWNRGV
tara:strand:- start:37 stop:243 length:207 start_codon:yes stop_codon:yes gene_type:complete